LYARCTTGTAVPLLSTANIIGRFERREGRLSALELFDDFFMGLRRREIEFNACFRQKNALHLNEHGVHCRGRLAGPRDAEMCDEAIGFARLDVSCGCHGAIE